MCSSWFAFAGKSGGGHLAKTAKHVIRKNSRNGMLGLFVCARIRSVTYYGDRHELLNLFQPYTLVVTEREDHLTYTLYANAAVR